MRLRTARDLVLMVLFISSLNLSAQAPAARRAPADQEGPSDSPLIRALEQRDLAHIRELLQSGASANQKDRFGMTPLAVAISLHNSDFAELLVLKGADVELTADNGASPLMTAAWYCDLGTARILLEHGAKVNHSDRDGETALGSAADACRSADMIKLLVASRAQVNAKTNRARTPLIIAAFNGNESAVRELVQAGADPNAKDARGDTAESSACERQVGRTENQDRICTLLARDR